MSRMLTRSRSRFCNTRCSSPARAARHDFADKVGAVARTRSSSRSISSRVKSSSAWLATISPKWPATTAAASSMRQPASSATSRPSA